MTTNKIKNSQPNGSSQIAEIEKKQKNGNALLLVGNPTSRSGKAAQQIERACKFMDERGMAHVFRPTLPDGHTVNMVKDAIINSGFKTIVYMGGDGTFNEVAKGIYLSGQSDFVNLGMLPAGTANDQGKSFGIDSAPKSLKKNIDTISKGYTTRLDVGIVSALNDNREKIKTDLFFDSIGWGLSAAILAFRNKELQLVKKMPVWRDMYRDQMVYVRAAVHNLTLNWLTRDRFAAEITVDGKTHHFQSLSDLVVSNTALYAGEWIIADNSKHDDGKVEIIPFCGTRDWTSKLIVHLKKNPITEDMLNRIGVSHSPLLSGSDIQIEILRPTKDKQLPSQLDGDEFLQANHFTVKVDQQRLRLIVPEHFHWI